MEVARFERETAFERKQNHLTGFIQDARFDMTRFNDERVRFDNTGVTMNPTDGAGITQSLYIGQMRAIDDQEVPKSKKARKRELKAKR